MMGVLYDRTPFGRSVFQICFARARVERHQVRRGLVVAHEDERSAIQRRRTGRPQLMAKGANSLARFLLHSCLPLMSTATTCPEPKTAYTRSPSTTGLALARLCFSWTAGRSPSAASSNVHARCPFTQLKASTTNLTAGPGIAPLPNGRSVGEASSPCPVGAPLGWRRFRPAT